jgi:hypothetical protein
MLHCFPLSLLRFIYTIDSELQGMSSGCLTPPLPELFTYCTYYYPSKSKPVPNVSGSLPPCKSAQLLTYFFEELDDFSIISMIFSQTKLDFRKIFEKINIFFGEMNQISSFFR